ncbi:25032_t:CDS:2 [Gigaspora rosea]|nr:25032_t:CDS:2 [Gigaspora rosea]
MSLTSSCQPYGQNETLVSSIRNITKDYPSETDDAGATRFHVIIDARRHPTETLLSNEMKAWQGPAILIFNNAKFKKSDFDSLMQIRVGGKQVLSVEIILHFLDPHQKYLPTKERGSIGTFPKEGINGFPERDQLAPYEGIEGSNFRSTFEGTLFRLPFRQQPSEISDSIFTTAQVLQLVNNIKSNAASQFLFLRNIETFEVSHIPGGTSPQQMVPLWKAAIIGLNDDVRNKRKRISNDELQIYEMKVELIDNAIKQIDHWIIATGAQKDPEDIQLKQYAKRHRLRILGGIAAQISSSKKRIHTSDQPINLFGNLSEVPSEFKGRMYSFLSLPDITNLPVHLSGTWAQSSDRARLLIEKDDTPDIDHLKLKWNRHILLEFLPKIHCGLLKEIIELQKSKKINLESKPTSKFWPFPPISRNHPRYTVEYGCKVLQHMLQTKDIFPMIADGSYDHRSSSVDILFSTLARSQIEDLRNLLRNNWDEIGVKYDHNLKTMILSLPMWPVRISSLDQVSKPALKPVSCGYILPKEVDLYKLKNNTTYLAYSDDLDERILADLNVPHRDVFSYIFEDVEFPKKYDDQYMMFLKSILKYDKDTPYRRIIHGLKGRRCFPTDTRKTLKKISDLYHNSTIFYTVFADSDVFLHPDLNEYSAELSAIGYKNRINQETFNKCAEKIEEYQNQRNPPTDLRYRGFVLVNCLYNNFQYIKLDSVERIPFVPVAKSLDDPYKMYYKPPRDLNCFKEIILPKYKEIAWSQKSLVAEDIIPPPFVLSKYPSLGKPDVFTVVKHLRFLHDTLLNDDMWKNDWGDTFKHNVYEVYKWLDEECSNEDINLGQYIAQNEPLFLNFHKNSNPFDPENWCSANDLVLNSEPGERKYVSPSLSKFSNMLKCANVREIKPPNVEIHVRLHNQFNFTNSMFEFLLNQDQATFLHDVVFNVSGEIIRTNRYMLAATSNFFREKFMSRDFAVSSPVNPVTIVIEDVNPNSVRVLLRYLYGQSIEYAIQGLNGIDINPSLEMIIYEDLLKLANSYELDHLKDLMELKLSRLVSISNVGFMRQLAINLNANQLEKYCQQFIIDYKDLM